jgi:hypothetical protein
MAIMRFELGKFLILLLWIQALMDKVIASSVRPKPNTFTQITSNEAQQIISAINNARGHTVVPAVAMEAIVWDKGLAGALEGFMRQGLEQNPDFPYWLFENYPNNTRNTLSSCPYNICHLMHMKIPQLEPYAQAGYDYAFRDTGANSEHGVSRTIRLRVSQDNCCHYYACNATQFNNFASCCNNELIKLANGKTKNCRWSYQYYPRIVMDAISEPKAIPNLNLNPETSPGNVACFRLGIPGPHTPDNQPNSFACFFLYNFINGQQPLSDRPFVNGPRGSGCNTAYNARKGLCY